MRLLIIIILLASLFLVACGERQSFSEDNEIEPAARTVCRERPEFCTQQYDPVIGSDGEEYSNGCVACTNSDVEWFEKK